MADEVVRLEELPAFVSSVIEGISKGVAELRAKGINAEMPTEVGFNVIVVKEWQALEIKGSEESTAEEKQGGTTKEKQGSTSLDASTKEERSTRDNQNAHDQQDTTTFESTTVA
jgi:hypothetical protein